MTDTSERSPRGGLGRLLVAAVAFVLFAPAGLVALPLAALLLVSGPRTNRELVASGAAVGYALFWLLSPGELPDQMVRAAALIATVVFTVAALHRRAPFIHHAMLASVAAALSVYLLALVLGVSWDQSRWWVEHRMGMVARGAIALSALATESGVLGLGPGAGEVEIWLNRVVAFMARFHPGVAALQLIAGLALASALTRRLAVSPRGPALGRLREFRFTEHLGWAAVIPLIVVLLPKLAAAKAAASNLLLVAGTLYAVRGLAVTAFGLQLIGAGGVATWLVGTIIAFFLLPVAIAGMILLGVLDAGLDLRRRLRPRSND
ncbi:MAG: DUF2232 domain-containing protein [Gemmatimonadales bacterium]